MTYYELKWNPVSVPAQIISLSLSIVLPMYKMFSTSILKCISIVLSTSIITQYMRRQNITDHPQNKSIHHNMVKKMMSQSKSSQSTKLKKIGLLYQIAFNCTWTFSFLFFGSPDFMWPSSCMCVWPWQHTHLINTLRSRDNYGGEADWLSTEDKTQN